MAPTLAEPDFMVLNAWYNDHVTIPLIFYSNFKVNQNCYQHSLKKTHSITLKFCTCQESTAVKYRYVQN